MLKNILKLMMVAVILFSFSTSNGSFFSDMSKKSQPITPYCTEGECSLENGIQIAKAGINDIEKTKSSSQYIQDIVSYLLNFITIVAVIYIIYAGFMILTGAGDEEKPKKSKNIITYVLIGVVIMWLSNSIVLWMLNVLNTGNGN